MKGLSIFKNFFKPSTWKGFFSGFGGKANGFFSKVTRGSRNAWNKVKDLVRKNPGVTGAIVAGTSVAFINRAINSLGEEAEAAESRNFNKYGAQTTKGARLAIIREARNGILASAERMATESFGGSIYERRKIITSLTHHYHMLINHLEDDDVDYAITSDRLLGAAARCGLRQELSSTNDALQMALTEAKDNEESYSDLAADLINVVNLDQLRIPLAPL